MEKIRTAVVGAGKMGAIHAKVYSQLDEAELVAIVDIDKAKADALADKYGCRAFTDYGELIGLVDAVTISAPTVCHRDLAKTFIENKIAVMIEKPLAASVEEGKDIVSCAAQHGVYGG